VETLAVAELEIVGIDAEEGVVLLPKGSWSTPEVVVMSTE